MAIISSYNDLLSAHAPLKDYPERLKVALARAGATSQFAAGVPAMCDGITQGEGGMQLSLFFSRPDCSGHCHRPDPRHLRRRVVPRGV